ncbi:MAG TPA: sigma-70 family RNA polymerase sigma factor [Kofleriaceae bacterium]|nr:sigma-70 family RNA polymerase sigma factor [Kofleriaceae bacterium]
MGANARRERFAAVVDGFVGRVYNFAFRMTLDAELASAITDQVFASAHRLEPELTAEDAGTGLALLRLAREELDRRLPRSPDLTFDVLDETLRSEATRTDVVRSLSDPQREYLLWELKQGCMTSVINCLPPGERAAFIAAHVLKLDDDSAAAMLGVRVSAFRVRLSRARQKVTDHLAPRCEHVDPMNPCRCPARVGTALRKGFITPMPVGGEVSLRGPQIPYGRYGAGAERDDAPMRDIAAIYGSLPDPEPPAALVPHLHDALAAGAWDPP